MLLSHNYIQYSNWGTISANDRDIILLITSSDGVLNFNRLAAKPKRITPFDLQGLVPSKYHALSIHLYILSKP